MAKSSAALGAGAAELPLRFRRIARSVAERDREWFEGRPDALYYVRPYVPGEFGPPLAQPLPQDAITVVVQLPWDAWIRGAVLCAGDVPVAVGELLRKAHPPLDW